MDESSKEIATLQNEDEKWRDMLDYANGKTKAAVIFVAYHDGVVRFLGDRGNQQIISGNPVQVLEEEKKDAGQLQIEKDVKEIVKSSNAATATLAGKFPELEQLVSNT